MENIFGEFRSVAQQGISRNGSPDGVIIRSSGESLLGALYLGEGDGPRPTALVMHGIPGIEKNTDIAYALRDAGWNALIFHYRGSWGSSGRYSLAGIPGDVIVALDELTNGKYPVDAERIALIGHSLGGWAAIVSAAHDSRVKSVVTIGGISDMRSWHLSYESATEYASFLSGISGTDLLSQFRALEQTRNPVDVVSDFEADSILIVHGSDDKEVPIEQAYALHKMSNGVTDLRMIADADHSFSHHRAQMVETVVSWLTSKM